MTALLSIIIPTLNAEQVLGQTVACLTEGIETGLVREIVVTDGGSDDGTTRIASEIGAKQFIGSAGRGGQLQRGAKIAQGEWMLFLHADTHLSKGWSHVVRDHIRGRAQAGYFRLRFRAAGFRPRLFELGANIRSWVGLPYGDQGLLISRATYDRIGGYADIPLMEDVAIVRNLKRDLIMLNATASTDPVRYQTGGWFRRGFRNVWTLMRYRLGVSPEKLAAQYDR